MIYFILLVSIITTGCSFRSKELLSFDRVTAKIDRALQNEESFQIYGSGYLGPGLKGLHLLYVSPEFVNRNEARRIFIRAIDTIISVANQDYEFLQYLNPSPLTSSQLLLNIEYNHDNTDRYIGMVIMAHDSISYYLTNPETFKSTKIATETLEEARAILNADDLETR